MMGNVTSHPDDIDAGLLDRWWALWSESPRPTPNARPDRFLATARALGTRPVLLEMRDEADRHGLVVARHERTRVANRIGYFSINSPKLDSLVVVHGGFLGEAEPGAYVNALKASMKRGAGCDLVLVNRLSCGDHVMKALKSESRAQVSPPEPHWVAELPGADYESALERHSSKTRNKFRYYERKLAKLCDGDLRVRVYSEPAEVPEFIASCERIASQTYQAALGFGVRDTPLWHAIIGAAAESGIMRSFGLIARGEMIAYQNGVLMDRRYWCDGKGYLPDWGGHRPGTTLYLGMLRELCAMGANEIDFGYGDADYKHLFGTKKWEESTVRLYGTSMRARLAAQLERWVPNVGMLDTTSSSHSRIKRIWRKWITPKNRT